MKYIYIAALLAATLIITPAFAEDGTPEGPTAEQKKIMTDCNLAARNSLINGNVKKVEADCTKAMKEMERSYPDKEYVINPILNLAFVYSLAGDYDRAEPLLKRAKDIGRKLYQPGSRELKAIEDFIEDQVDRKNNPSKFDNQNIRSPH